MHPEDAHDEADDPRLGDSSFWFSPYSIPQYELLVKQGRVSPEDAERFKADREAMGLPMRFAELKPRPHPAFEWLVRAGGPIVSHDGERVDLDGEDWSARVWSTLPDGPGELTHHKAGGGYDVRKLTRPTAGDGVAWEATYKVAENVYARVGGKEADFHAARAAARAMNFVPQPLGGGLEWFANSKPGEGWVASVDGQPLELSCWTSAPERQWQWRLGLADGSPAQRMARLFGDFCLRGSASSMEEAISAALGAPAQLKTLAAELLGDESFEAGRLAGRAELKALIVGL